MLVLLVENGSCLCSWEICGMVRSCVVLGMLYQQISMKLLPLSSQRNTCQHLLILRVGGATSTKFCCIIRAEE